MIDTEAQLIAWVSQNVTRMVLRTSSGEVIPVPCCTTILVQADLVTDNLYNPNAVSPDKMELLRQSIMDNGMCFPVVTVWDPDLRRLVVVDGAHRRAILGPGWLGCTHVPVVVLPHDASKRLAATWQFNKARGVHQVDLDAELIRRMIEQGVSEEDVAQKLGVDLDTVHRYKQVTGIAELFRNATWSTAWEMTEDP